MALSTRQDIMDPISDRIRTRREFFLRRNTKPDVRKADSVFPYHNELLLDRTTQRRHLLDTRPLLFFANRQTNTACHSPQKALSTSYGQGGVPCLYDLCDIFRQIKKKKSLTASTNANPVDWSLTSYSLIIVKISKTPSLTQRQQTWK